MSAAQLERLRALVVDDNHDDVETFSRLLELKGCKVAACEDAMRAVAIAREFRPHVIFLDLAMPQLDGLAVSRMLKQLELPPFLLIARTGFSDPAIAEQCVASGFACVLVKPGTSDQVDCVLDAAALQVRDLQASQGQHSVAR
jgi:CheY-like chemotaxis protein